MKKLLLMLLFVPGILMAQKTTYNITYDGLDRKYIEYIPSSYDGSTPFPLVFVLHGLGDNADNFSNVGFEQLSESEDFIVITPEAIASFAGTAWNSGAGIAGIALNPDVDDVGLISFLIDSAANAYNIDLNRVYSTGFSMGGFMSNRLACELNDKIAAIGSVAGTIGSNLTCQPGRDFPMIHFHGTSDGTVAYTGNLFGQDAEATVEFWADNNGCDGSPSSTNLPDNAADGITIEHKVYNNCNRDVEFYKANNAAHNWLFTPSNDVSYTPIIWEFFSRQTLNLCSPPVVDLGADVALQSGQSVTLDATTSGATYLWSDGSTGPTLTVNQAGTYTVTVTVGACSASDAVNVEILTGLLNNEAISFNVYPNPSTEYVNIQLNGKGSVSSLITLYNTDGKMLSVQSTTSNHASIDLSDLSKGLYVIKVVSNGDYQGKAVILKQ